MAKSLSAVQPPLAFIPPDFQLWVWWMARSLLPLRLRWSHGIDAIHTQNLSQLVDLYRQFQAGDVRVLFAFRHPSTSDPECLFHLLAQSLPAAARRQGISLPSPTHTHFIYDRGIPLWAGERVGWLYAKLGGIPVRRGKADTTSLRAIRQLFASGRFPMTAAPEGATNGHNEIVSPIEPGIAQFGFWCVEDLAKANRPETVLIVPIGVQYHYLTPPWHRLEQVLQRMEADSGITQDADPDLLPLQDGSAPTPAQQAALYHRLFRLGEYLLSVMEGYYSRFYQQPAPVPPPEPRTMPLSNEELATRLQDLLSTALAVAEQFFGLQPTGSLPDRCRRIEQAAWDRIYREDLNPLDGRSPIELGLADRLAEEANLRIWHMRLVETFISVTGNYVREKPSAERFGETLILLWDMVSRLKGEAPYPYPQLGKRQAFLTIGEPLSVSDRLPSYRSNRRQAVASLTQDLQAALEAMIQR